jgi:large subunit ribosomal protein L9
MKVLLLQEIPKVGHKNEVVDVSEGYAKNYLLLTKKAVIATPQIISEHKQKKDKEVKLREEKTKEIEILSNKLSEQTFQFEVKTGKGGEVFSSVHDSQIREKILEFIKNNGGGALTIDDIQFESKPIKELGEKTISLRIGKGEHSKQTSVRIIIESKK